MGVFLVKILWIVWSFLIMAVPCEKSTEAHAQLAAESFEEGFEESCPGISPFSYIAELPTGKEKGV